MCVNVLYIKNKIMTIHVNLTQPHPHTIGHSTQSPVDGATSTGTSDRDKVVDGVQQQHREVTARR